MEEHNTSEIDDIWRRLDREPITEHDFLTVAYWAYHAMPAENVRSALFQLYMRAHTPPRRSVH
jgi:hypothetical protein